jgi:hypothetical protein
MTRFLAACALVIGLSGFAARADEMDIPLDKIPAKAMAAVKKLFPGAKPVAASTDTVDGVVEYTVTLRHNENTYEVTVTADGKILEIAREMEFKDLPKPVATAFLKRYPKAKVEGVWELTVPGVKGKTYQIDFVTADGKDLTAEFDADGRLLSEDDEGRTTPERGGFEVGVHLLLEGVQVGRLPGEGRPEDPHEPGKLGRVVVGEQPRIVVEPEELADQLDGDHLGVGQGGRPRAGRPEQVADKVAVHSSSCG